MKTGFRYKPVYQPKLKVLQLRTLLQTLPKVTNKKINKIITARYDPEKGFYPIPSEVS